MLQNASTLSSLAWEIYYSIVRLFSFSLFLLMFILGKSLIVDSEIVWVIGEKVRQFFSFSVLVFDSVNDANNLLLPESGNHNVKWWDHNKRNHLFLKI